MTVKSSVEKSFAREGAAAGIGKSVASIDVAAEVLLANLILLNTYEQKNDFLEKNGNLPWTLV